MSEQSFDANAYKANQHHEWKRSATGWQQYWDIWEQGAQHVNERLVELAQILPGHRVVDIASGVGEPACTAARHVGPTGQVISTDFAPEMLEIAHERAKELGLHQVEFRVMDAEEPDLPEQSFNAVLCRFALMFLPNLTTALTRLRQLLVPGGRFAAAVWGPAEQCAFMSVINQAIRQVRQPPPPPPGTPGGSSLGNEDILIQRFQEAGFTEVRTERTIVTLEYTTPELYFQERLATGANTRMAFNAATEEEQTAIRQAATESLQAYQESDGIIRLPNAVICCVAW